MEGFHGLTPQEKGLKESPMSSLSPQVVIENSNVSNPVKEGKADTGDLFVPICPVSPVSPKVEDGPATKSKTSTPVPAVPRRGQWKGPSNTQFLDPKDLPDENSILTENQIRQLIHCAPAVRKRYPSYFLLASGHIRAQWLPLLFERYSNGELQYPAGIIASNVAQWQAKLSAYESPKRQKRREKDTPANSAKPAGRSQQPSMSSNQLGKRPAPQGDRKSSNDVTKKQKQEPVNGGSVADAIKVPAIPVTTADEIIALTGALGQPNNIPGDFQHLSGFDTNETAIHSHPMDTPSPPVANGYNDHQTIDTAPIQLETYTGGMHSEQYVSPTNAGNFMMGPSPVQAELLLPDSLRAFIRWIQVQTFRLNQSLVESNEIGRSHNYQSHVTQLLNSLYQVRMACLELESVIRAEYAMQ